MSVKGQINIRMDDEDKKPLLALQKRFGTSQAGIIARLIRDECARLNREEAFHWRQPKV
jgi:hypothetical protein